MEENQFVDKYAVKKVKFLEQHNKMLTLGIGLSHPSQFILKIIFTHKNSFLFDCIVITWPMKLFMDILHIPYVDIKDELTDICGYRLDLQGCAWHLNTISIDMVFH
jgi:hypothetical protein